MITVTHARCAAAHPKPRRYAAAALSRPAPRRLRGRPSGLKGPLTRSLRDGLRPPLTPEPLRP